jgi:hypothetical protein
MNRSKEQRTAQRGSSFCEEAQIQPALAPLKFEFLPQGTKYGFSCHNHFFLSPHLGVTKISGAGKLCQVR